MTVELDIFIEANCSNCATAVEIAGIVQQSVPEVEVRLIDITQPDASCPESVFAVPTYLLNGELCSLGNPDADQLIARLETMVGA